MRMWMTDVRTMCDKHLLGEHVETHMFVGAMRRGVRLDGYVKNNLFEPLSLKARHDALATEMQVRGMKHASHMDAALVNVLVGTLPDYIWDAKVDKVSSLEDLIGRCPKCKMLHRKDKRDD